MGFLSGPWGVHQARPRGAEVLAKTGGALVLGVLSSRCLLPPCHPVGHRVIWLY